MTISTRREQIIASFTDKEYRDEFVAENIATGLAFQIRSTRKDRGWTQEELAERTGIAQATLSKLEDPDYGRYTLTTLRRLASTFDTALMVRFTPFSQLIDSMIALSERDLAVPGFADDLNRRPTRAEMQGPPAQLRIDDVPASAWQTRSELARSVGSRGPAGEAEPELAEAA